MKIVALHALSSVGLYGQWITGFYQPGGRPTGEPFSAIPWNKYTHIIHQQVWPTIEKTLTTKDYTVVLFDSI